VYAICLRCGETKNAPYEQCGGCGYHPADDESLVKSVYLSVGRYDSPAEQSQYKYELKKLAKQIHEGNEIAFDSVDITRLQKQKIEVESVGDLGVLRYLAKVFFPGLLFLFILLGVLMALKMR
jgi:hypothetical protein